jgi:ribosomal protein S18 acetylase RimI-like enzyme
MEQNEVLGIVALSTQMDEVYKPVNWLTETTKHLYVHRLAVKPEKWRNGIASKLMDYAENFAQTQECISIRLDTFSQNKRNQKFYEARGYFKLENIFFPEKSEHPFYCYELIL